MGAAPKWNWASGSEWAPAEATQQWPPAAPQWPPASAEAAVPPWMAPTQQPSWPTSSPAWPPAGGAAAQGGFRSMSGPAAGFVGSFARAPVATRNRFMPLDDQGREHSREVTLAGYMIEPKKPRRGRTARPSTCASSGDSKPVLGIQEQGALPRVPGAPTGSDASAAWTSREAISSTVTSASPLTLCTTLVPVRASIPSAPVSHTDGLCCSGS